MKIKTPVTDTRRRMKKGDRIEIESSTWRGSRTRDGRNSGVIVRIGPVTFGDTRLELEMSFEEWGKVVAGEGGTATIEGIR